MSEEIDFPDGIIRPMPDVPAPFPSLPIPRPSGSTKPPPLPGFAPGPASQTNESDLPVGWLVIIAGPGHGRSLPLISGMNPIGRAVGNRLVLDFGDEGISPKSHAIVTFDPLGRKFYVQPGPESLSLTYLEDDGATQPVLTPTEIESGAVLVVAKTKLRFAPFCGPAFSWE